jgi:hypothetical protein
MRRIVLVSSLRSSFKKSNRCQPLEANPNPPFPKGEFSQWAFNLFGKEGKGRFFAEADRNYVANFWVTTLVRDTNAPILKRGSR